MPLEQPVMRTVFLSELMAGYSGPLLLDVVFCSIARTGEKSARWCLVLSALYHFEQGRDSVY